MPAGRGHGERFDEFVREARRGGRDFRAFVARDAAETWLASLPEPVPPR